MSARYTKYNIQFTSAYTLIEILVALSIIGLLFSFGYANFRDFSRRQVIAGTAKAIQGDLRLAQADATSGQKPIDVNCNPPNTLDSYSFKVFSNSEYRIEANCVGVLANSIVVKDVNLPSGITISTPSPNPLMFKVLGQGTNIPGADWVLILTQTGTAPVNVTVTLGGQIK